MKNTKRCFTLFSFYDRTGIEAYLEKQAESGWMLDKVSDFSWKFHRIEPKKIHFSVVYFQKASKYDPEPSESQLLFNDFCEHTGWKLASSNAQMQIFYNEADSPTPIETDAVLEVDAIHTSVQKKHFIGYYIFAFFGIILAALSLWQILSSPIYFFANNARMLSAISCILKLSLVFTEIVKYHSWHRRAKSAAKLNGSFVKTKGGHNFLIIIIFLLLFELVTLMLSYGGSKMPLIALITVTIMLFLAVIIACISQLIKKMKLSAKINRNVTVFLTIFITIGFTALFSVSVVSRLASMSSEKTPSETYEFMGSTFKVYNDELPLTIDDLIETNYDGYSNQIRSFNSVLIEHKEASQRPRMDALAQPNLTYSITTIKAPFMYGVCKKALLDKFSHNYGRPVPEYDGWEEHIKIDSEPWGANEVYQLKLEGEMQMHFILCYDTCIVDIKFERYWQLTAEQMATVAEKIGK